MIYIVEWRHKERGTRWWPIGPVFNTRADAEGHLVHEHNTSDARFEHRVTEL